MQVAVLAVVDPQVDLHDAERLRAVLPPPRLADNVVRRRGHAIERAGDRDVVDQGFEREDARHDPCIAARPREDPTTSSVPDVMAVLADAYDAFLFDLDGVLYRGTEVVPGAPEAVARLRAAGKRVAFVTNNATRTPEAVADPSRRGSASRPRRDEVESSALVTAAQLAARGVSEAFVVGEEGVLQALRDAGIAIADVDARSTEVVVVGLDRRVDYEKLRRASLLVQRGAALVATNTDASYPAADGNWPGAGALLAAIEATTGVRAEAFGKPEAPIMRAALERAGGGTPLVIGDRLETDIAAAVALGWDSLLVLTGIASVGDVEASPIAPTFVADDLTALFAPRPS